MTTISVSQNGAGLFEFRLPHMSQTAADRHAEWYLRQEFIRGNFEVYVTQTIGEPT